MAKVEIRLTDEHGDFPLGEEHPSIRYVDPMARGKKKGLVDGRHHGEVRRKATEMVRALGVRPAARLCGVAPATLLDMVADRIHASSQETVQGIEAAYEVFEEDVK